MVHRVDTDTMTRKGGSTKGQLTEAVHTIHRVPADIITVDGIHPLENHGKAAVEAIKPRKF